METLFTIATWLNKIGSLGLVIAVIVGLVVFFVKDARQVYGNYLTALSYFLGFGLWLLCVVVLHDIWGYTGIVIGVLLGGIGVIPLCQLAVAIHGQWMMLGNLILSLIVVFACRFGGIAIVEKDKERRERESRKVEELESRVRALERQNALPETELLGEDEP